MNCDLITLTFQDESAAERGHAVLRDLIKLVYGEEKGLLPEQAGQKKNRTVMKYRRIVIVFPEGSNRFSSGIRFRRLHTENCTPGAAAEQGDRVSLSAYR